MVKWQKFSCLENTPYTHVYDDAAAFATDCGDRLVAISGTPIGTVGESNFQGDVVVWFHEAPENPPDEGGGSEGDLE